MAEAAEKKQDQKQDSPPKEVVEATKEEQERNDAAKADKVESVTPGQGLPPVLTEIDELVPVPVSTDAPKEEQEKAVELQSHAPADIPEEPIK